MAKQPSEIARWTAQEILDALLWARTGADGKLLPAQDVVVPLTKMQFALLFHLLDEFVQRQEKSN